MHEATELAEQPTPEQRIAALEAQVAERDARIAELEAGLRAAGVEL